MTTKRDGSKHRQAARKRRNVIRDLTKRGVIKPGSRTEKIWNLRKQFKLT